MNCRFPISCSLSFSLSFQKARTLRHTILIRFQAHDVLNKESPLYPSVVWKSLAESTRTEEVPKGRKSG